MSVDPTRISLFKRRNGYHSILYYDGGRRRWKATGATTKQQALLILTRFRDLLIENKKPVSLAEFQLRFLEFADANFSKATVDLYRMVLARFIKLVGNLDLSQLTAEHFDRYKAQRL